MRRQLLLDHLLAARDVLRALLALEPLRAPSRGRASSAGSRGSGSSSRATGPSLDLRRQDLDDFAVLQLVVERHQPPVHLRARRSWWPRSVWMRYAKSSGVLPAGMSLISPFGVKTNTWSWKMSVFTASTNSSRLRPCRAASRAAAAATPSAPRSGCPACFAAFLVPPVRRDHRTPPRGASRACGSAPPAAASFGAITVVCSDWYMLSFGFAM